MVGNSFKDDALTRDFTMNTVYFEVLTGLFIDPINAIPDIESKVIRPVNEDCATVFNDKVRVLRALRLSCCLNFELSTNATAYIRNIDQKVLYQNLYVGKLEYSKACKGDYLLGFFGKLIEFQLIWHYPFNILFENFNHSSYMKRLLIIASKHSVLKQLFNNRIEEEKFSTYLKIYLIFVYLSSHTYFKPYVMDYCCKQLLQRSFPESSDLHR